MSAARTASLINSWDTVRYELLNTRICDLRLKIEGSPLDPLVQRMEHEFEAKGIRFKPACYLTDSWGCPDEVPVIGIPFYLADKRLRKIEEEQTGEVEDENLILMFLRHEAGHAINYAYHLWERADWTGIFGRFSKPYRDTFHPNIASRDFVRHLPHGQHGPNYAQKHPDEDFAETFAVWIAPRSAWRRKYGQWPALRKLRYVDSLMRFVRDRAPRCTTGKLVNPLEEMTMLLAEHYGQRAKRYRAAAQGYVDDKLHGIFPSSRGRNRKSAAELLECHRDELVRRIARWSGLGGEDVETIIVKLQHRAQALQLEYPAAAAAARLMDVTALGTALAMDFTYMGRFTA